MINCQTYTKDGFKIKWKEVPPSNKLSEDRKWSLSVSRDKYELSTHLDDRPTDAQIEGLMMQLEDWSKINEN